MKNVSSINSLEKNVPRLRFPGFEGEWETVKLSDFVERVTRKNTNSQSDLPLTISSKDGLVDQISYFSKTVASKDMSGYYLLLNGEFAYNKSYSVGYDYGSIKRLDRYPMGALSTLYICFALKKYDSDFIKIYFDSLKWYREIYMIAAEGARNHGLLNIPTDEFFKTRHTLPMNIEEQKKIASFLTLLDERISKQRELVESLKSYKRGVLAAIFDTKIRFLNKDGNSFPRWEKCTIGTIFSERLERATGDEDLLAVTINSGIIKRDEIELKNNSSDDKSNYKCVHINDIAYNTMRMWQGASGVSVYDGIVSPAYTVIYAKDLNNTDIRFWGYYFKAYKLICEFQRYSQGLTSDTWNLKYPQLADIEIFIPCVQEQKKIADFLDNLQRTILEYEKCLDELSLQRSELLRLLFI